MISGDDSFCHPEPPKFINKHELCVTPTFETAVFGFLSARGYENACKRVEGRRSKEGNIRKNRKQTFIV